MRCVQYHTYIDNFIGFDEKVGYCLRHGPRVFFSIIFISRLRWLFALLRLLVFLLTVFQRLDIFLTRERAVLGYRLGGMWVTMQLLVAGSFLMLFFIIFRWSFAFNFTLLGCFTSGIPLISLLYFTRGLTGWGTERIWGNLISLVVGVCFLLLLHQEKVFCCATFV